MFDNDWWRVYYIHQLGASVKAAYLGRCVSVGLESQKLPRYRRRELLKFSRYILLSHGEVPRYDTY